MIQLPIRTWSALVLTGLLAIPSVSFPATHRPNREQARAAFERADGLRSALESQPEKERHKADYENVIRAFQAVYRASPAYTKTPLALAAVGELYEEMGRIFSSERYTHSSIQAYEFLVSQYPKNPASREALFKIGEIYRTGLENPEEARKTFQKFLEQYPKSARAAEAREQLTQIDQEGAERARSPAASRRAEIKSEHAGQIPEVTTVRHWVGPNYSRIVIGVDEEVKFDTLRLGNPDRIVLDLTNTRLSPNLSGKTFPGEDGFLRQIRLAQYKPNVTRVVLDVEKIEDYSVFSLPNPFRLVIDIHGTPAASVVTARRAVSASQTPPELPKPGEKSTPSTRPEPNAPIKPAKPTESGSQTLTRALGLKVAKIVIDPGHGGHDTGTLGPTGLLEKDLVLDVALRLKKLIEKNLGSQVMMTRIDDTFVPLEERTAIANQNGADLFVSVHANASRDRSARGIETYYLNFTSNAEALEVAARENATSQESVHQLQDLIKKIAMTEKIEESHEFATQVQRQMHDRLAKSGDKQRDRGVKKAPFVVLIGANMPSILAEISFLTNPRDERLLKRPDFRQKIAAALYQGITRYTSNLSGIKVAQKARLNETPSDLAAREAAPAGRPNF